MASGIEIAGLVIGAFPLLVEGVKFYMDACRPLDDWIHFERTYVEFFHKVNREHLYYDAHIKLVILPLMKNGKTTFAKLKSELEHGHSTGLDEALQAKLGRIGYEEWKYSIKEMKVYIDKLIKRLKIDKLDPQNMKTTDLTEAQRKTQYQRVTICFTKYKADRLIQRVHEQNDALQRLTDMSADVAALETSMRASSQRGSVNKMRSAAKVIYDSIQRRLSSSCTHLHQASLQLQPISDLNVSESTDQKYGVTVLISVPNQNNPTSAGSWRQTRIYVEERDNESVKDSVKDQRHGVRDGDAKNPANNRGQTSKMDGMKVVDTTNSTATTSQSNSTTVPKKKPWLLKIFKAPQVRSKHNRELQLVTNRASTSSNSSTQEVPGQSDTPVAQDVKASPVTSICDLIQLDPKSHEPLEISNAENECKVWARFDGVLSHTSAINLQRLLRRREDTRNLSRKERMKLAVVIASSVMQLFGTSWLNRTFNKETFLFYRTLPQQGQNEPCYVATTFENSVGDTNLSMSNSEAMATAEQVLLSLGILLMELLFGQAIEDQECRRLALGPDGNPTPYTDKNAAQEWLKRVEEEAGLFYFTAVRLCINCAFQSTNIDLNDNEFSQLVHDSVVNYLEETYQRSYPEG